MGGERLLKVRDFYINTGLLTLDKLEQRGIFPDAGDGCFYQYRVQELFQLCIEHPDLHIISQVEMTSFNRFEPNACGYYLGDGNNDPSLSIVHQFPSPEEWGAALEELLLIPEDQRTGIDRLGIHICSAGAGRANLQDARTFKKVIQS